MADAMAFQLNHTIVSVRDKHESATFLSEILGVTAPEPFGPFLVVQVDNDVSLDFADDHGPVHPQHYAFLVGEDQFDQIFARIRERDLPYWADPGRRSLGGSREFQGDSEWPSPNGTCSSASTSAPKATPRARAWTAATPKSSTPSARNRAAAS